MKRRWRLPAAVLLVCVLGGEAAADAPRWLNDWEEGKKAAKAGGKPIFVVFRCEH